LVELKSKNLSQEEKAAARSANRGDVKMWNLSRGRNKKRIRSKKTKKTKKSKRKSIRKR